MRHSTDHNPNHRIGQLLIESGIISQEQLDIALKHQSHCEERIGSVLLRLGYLKTETLLEFLRKHFGTPSLITRNTNDVQQVQMVVLLALTMMAMAPIMGIGGLFMAIRVNARLSLEKLERETKLRSSFRAPTVAFVDESFEIKAEVCNEALDEEVINVRESHDARVFKEEARGYALELAGQQCAEIVVPFTPKAAAKTTILFNLISRDNSEKQQIRLEVRE